MATETIRIIDDLDYGEEKNTYRIHAKRCVWNDFMEYNQHPSGLEAWFADKVTAEDRFFTFKWGKTETRNAEVINLRTGSFIRFRWEDEIDTKYYFELKISVNELTNDYMLEVIDFAEPGEEDDLIELWNSQFETLRRASGV